MIAFKRLGLVLAGLAAGLLCGEAVVRLLDRAPPLRPVREGRILRASKDPVLRVELMTDATLVTTYANGGGEPPLVVEHNVGPRGLRETSASQPDANARRIACLGDSFTFGSGVADHEAWPSQLQALFEAEQARAPTGAPPVRVFNLAVPGYDVLQNARQLEGRAVPLAPEIVILCWYVNDLAIPGVEGGDVTAVDDLPWWVASLGRAERPDHPLQASHLARLAVERLIKPRLRRFFLGSHERLYADDHAAWRAGREALRGMQAALDDAGIEFLVVLYPTLFPGPQGLASRAAYDRVAAFCRDEGIAVLDLEPWFAGADLRALRVHRFDGHPNGRAHALAAEAVHAWLREREPPAPR